jgi:hypothetical protein
VQVLQSLLIFILLLEGSCDASIQKRRAKRDPTPISLKSTEVVPGINSKGHKTVIDSDTFINSWLDIADRASKNGYVPVKSYNSLPNRVRGDLFYWSERFFSKDGNPHAQPENIEMHPETIKYGVHVATSDMPDLLRYEYQAKGLHLEAIESAAFTLIRVKSPNNILSLKDEERIPTINTIATSILNMEDLNSPDQEVRHRWNFKFPPKIADGIRFSTDPNANLISMYSWISRADGGIHHGNLFFICFKKHSQKAGFGDMKAWFDPPFRTQYQRKP